MKPWRVIVVGLGVQGSKRRRIAAADVIASVDPENMEAEYRSIFDVSLDSYDAVLACIPDEPKTAQLRYFLSHGKHVLVEKPLWANSAAEILELEGIARAHRAVCYTAYNH